jgi:hypothetical protein
MSCRDKQSNMSPHSSGIPKTLAAELWCAMLEEKDLASNDGACSCISGYRTQYMGLKLATTAHIHFREEEV